MLRDLGGLNTHSDQINSKSPCDLSHYSQTSNSDIAPLKSYYAKHCGLDRQRFRNGCRPSTPPDPPTTDARGCGRFLSPVSPSRFRYRSLRTSPPLAHTPSPPRPKSRDHAPKNRAPRYSWVNFPKRYFSASPSSSHRFRRFAP